jgi:hypothetical protein
MMGMVEVTIMHSQSTGKLELSPSLEAELSLLTNSSRMACSDGDPLWTIPMKIAPESSFPLGDRL